MEKKQTVTTKGDQFLAKAGIAGTVGAFVAASLNGVDVTKIRMQNQKTVIYEGLVSGMKKIFREEGIHGLSKGVEASMLREITYSSIRIGGYEPIRKALSYDSVDPTNTSPMVKFLSALISGGVGSALANPLDLIKTRFQATLANEQLPYRNTVHALRTIYDSQGFAGLYRGWAVTSARAAVLTSAQLGSYDSIKHNLLIKVFGLKEGFLLHLSCSMVAGIITTTAANPCKSTFGPLCGIVLTCHDLFSIVDVIKTRYLSDRGGQYNSIMDCVQKTYQGEGLNGFMKVYIMFVSQCS